MQSSASLPRVTPLARATDEERKRAMENSKVIGTWAETAEFYALTSRLRHVLATVIAVPVARTRGVLAFVRKELQVFLAQAPRFYEVDQMITFDYVRHTFVDSVNRNGDNKIMDSDFETLLSEKPSLVELPVRHVSIGPYHWWKGEFDMTFGQPAAGTNAGQSVTPKATNTASGGHEPVPPPPSAHAPAAKPSAAAKASPGIALKSGAPAPPIKPTGRPKRAAALKPKAGYREEASDSASDVARIDIDLTDDSPPPRLLPQPATTAAASGALVRFEPADDESEEGGEERDQGQGGDSGAEQDAEPGKLRSTWHIPKGISVDFSRTLKGLEAEVGSTGTFTACQVYSLLPVHGLSERQPH